jgi:hypothetical protein
LRPLLLLLKPEEMRINIWIKSKSVDELAHFLSDEIILDSNPKIYWWRVTPDVNPPIGNYIQVSLTYDQFKKLEDL